MMKISMPTHDEKRRSIDTILLSVPQKPASFTQTAGDMLRLLGLRGLFFGVGDASFIALMSAVILCAPIFATVRPGGVLGDMFYGMLFFFSPLTYMLLYSLTAWKERITGAWEINNTCRFTLRHLTAVRMLCFGGVGMVMCAALSFVLALYSEVAFLRLLGLTLCSLFLFAVVFMFLMLKLREILAQAICVGLWCVLSIAFGTDAGVLLKNIIDGLPIAVLLIAAVSFLTIFVLETRAYFMKKGETSYAVG